MCFSSLREAPLNELKRKEFTGRLGNTQEHRGMVGQLTLDQHIGVRIPGGQPGKHFLEPSPDFSVQSKRNI
jgi:hypothetical protein